jgi:hypothetical protein
MLDKYLTPTRALASQAIFNFENSPRTGFAACKPPLRQLRQRQKKRMNNRALNGAPEEIRTPDPQIRSLVLYPAELRALLPFRRRDAPGDRFRDR